MNINYNTGIPAANNDPSVDQPKMLVNTNSINTWVTIDHFGFNTSGSTNNQGGQHQQVTLINQSGVPASRTNTMVTLYSKKGGSVVGSKSELFFSTQTDGRQYQMTRSLTDSTSNSRFAQNPNYQAASNPSHFPSITGGWTFLPGGMLLQYGIATSVDFTVQNIITFPIPFTSFVGSITVSPVRNSTADKVIGILDGSIGLTLFKLNLSGSSQPTQVTWMAIGV